MSRILIREDVQVIDFLEFEPDIGDSFHLGIEELGFAYFDPTTSKRKTLNTYALRKMVRNVYPKVGTQGKRHHGKDLHGIVSVIEKAVYWHEWSIWNDPQGDGSFYKSYPQWDTELDVSRRTVEGAIEFLTDLSCLKTENRSTNTLYSVKYWILDKEYFRYVLSVYAACLISCYKTFSTRENYTYFKRKLDPHAQCVAENSSFFDKFLDKIGYEKGWGSVTGDRGGLSPVPTK
jgi:hypothetical protein